MSVVQLLIIRWMKKKGEMAQSERQLDETISQIRNSSLGKVSLNYNGKLKMTDDCSPGAKCFVLFAIIWSKWV